MTTILAVSPHLDDAVFSAGGLLRRLARHGCRVVVATVFTGNVAQPRGFALACQLDKGLGPDIDYMALRRAEDETACAVLGAEHRHLPLLEAPHRGYDNAKALFAEVRADDHAGLAVREQLESMLAELQPDWLAGPQAIGGHVDHLIVRDAVAALAPAGTLWWEDWPYVLRDPVSAAGKRSAWLPLGRSARVDKFRACSAYASQLGYQFGGAARLEDLLQQQQGEFFTIKR